MRRLAFILTPALALSLTGCGYNSLQTNDDQIKASWADVLNQYQRRADLLPNLANTVKGYAAQEKNALTQVTQARASVGGMKAMPEQLNDPAAFAKSQQAQNQLSVALSRLLVVSVNHPQLKSDANVRDLQTQLAGTENRISLARDRYKKSVQQDNVTVRSFPPNLAAIAFGHKPKPNFTVDKETAISTRSKVELGSSHLKPPGETQGSTK